MMKQKSLLLLMLLCVSISSIPQSVTIIKSGDYSFEIPKEYLEERDDIPSFWLSSNEEVTDFLQKTVKKGTLEVIGSSAGGRPIMGVYYGTPRSMDGGTTTFSGSLGARDMKAYRGVDHDKTVYLGLAGVHGGEFEGIVGTINLISIIETGKDLRGVEWPEITDIVQKIDRLILIPIVNPDGRERIPLRMQKYNDINPLPYEFLNTGGHPDGTLIGWRKGKSTNPMDFNRPGFPGGYPNDAGVNLMHDDFLGNLQPETQVLYDVVASEKPDITINMHTGADYMFLLRPFSETTLQPIFDNIYTRVHSRLAEEGLLKTKDIANESDPSKVKMGTYNLNSALNLHSGTLCITVESPSHGFARTSGGVKAVHTPEMLLDAQLFCHSEMLCFLVESGGRAGWNLP